MELGLAQRKTVLFLLFIFIAQALVTPVQAKSYTNFQNMKTDGDVLWVRVPGDGSLQYITTLGDLHVHNLTSGDEISTLSLLGISDVLNGNDRQCPTSWGDGEGLKAMNIGNIVSGQQNPEYCTIINGDYSINYSALHLTICSVFPVIIPVGSYAGNGLILFSQDYCEFITLDSTYELIGKYSSTDNYSVSYDTDVATYRIFSNDTIENLDTGATGILPKQYCGYRQAPPYVLLNGTFLVHHNQCNGSPNMKGYYYGVTEHNQSLEFTHTSTRQLIDENSGWDSCISPSQSTGVLYSNYNPISEIYDLEYGLYSDYHNFDDVVADYLDEHTMIPPKWFMFRVLDDQTDCSDSSTVLVPTDYLLVPYDLDRGTLWYNSYDTDLSHPSPCVISYHYYGKTGEGEYLLVSCGVHDGVEYQWDSSNNLVESFGGIVAAIVVALLLLLALIIVSESSESDITSVTPLQEKGPSPRSSSYKGNDIEGILNSVGKLFPNRGFSELPILTQILVAVMELQKKEEWRQVVVLAEIALREPGLKDMDRILVQGSLLEAKKNLKSSADLFKEWQKLPSHSGGHRCSVGTGFWGTEECGGNASHLCQRCMKYACRSHITTQRTYGGEAVCETCNRGMQDDA